MREGLAYFELGLAVEEVDDGDEEHAEADVFEEVGLVLHDGLEQALGVLHVAEDK